jgi:hypothetical protein
MLGGVPILQPVILASETEHEHKMKKKRIEHRLEAKQLSRLDSRKIIK